MLHALPLLRTRRSGFTLVELLVVLIVISVLIGFTTVRVTDAIDSAQNSEARAMAKNGYKSAQAYFTDNDESYGNTAGLVAHLVADGLDAEAMTGTTDDPSAEGKLGVFVTSSTSVYFEYGGKAGTNYYVQDSGGVVTSGVATSGGPAALAASTFVFYEGTGSTSVSLGSDGTGRAALNGISTGRHQISPDRTKILYEYTDGVTNEYVLGVMDSDGSNATDLTADTATNTQGTWSPDGTEIVFASFRDGNLEIYKMDADGSNETRLTNTAGSDEQSPSFSPDGTQISYTIGVFGTKDLYVMNADGSGQTNLTSGQHDSNPVWATNSVIVFVSGDSNIYQINDSGAGRTQLTTTGDISDFVVNSTGTRVFGVSNGNQRVRRANIGGGGEMWLTNICPNTPSGVTISPDDATVAFLCDGNIYTGDATVGASAAPAIVPNTNTSPSELTWSGIKTAYMF